MLKAEQYRLRLFEKDVEVHAEDVVMVPGADNYPKVEHEIGKWLVTDVISHSPHERCLRVERNPKQ